MGGSYVPNNLPKKAVIRSPLPSITYHWQFYCAGRGNMDHNNFRTCDQTSFTKKKSIAQNADQTI